LSTRISDDVGYDADTKVTSRTQDAIADAVLNRILAYLPTIGIS
jgi:hypothetical protein